MELIEEDLAAWGERLQVDEVIQLAAQQQPVVLAGLNVHRGGDHAQLVALLHQRGVRPPRAVRRPPACADASPNRLTASGGGFGAVVDRCSGSRKRRSPSAGPGLQVQILTMKQFKQLVTSLVNVLRILSSAQYFDQCIPVACETAIRLWS